MRMIRWVSGLLGMVVSVVPLLADNQSQDAGRLYLEGRKLALGEGCQVDMNRARECYRKAADLGDPRAIAWKARSLYSGGRGFPKNEGEACKLFKEVEPRLREMGEKKEEDASGSLCRTLATLDPKARGAEAFALAQKNVIHGQPSDWNTLGWFFCHGIGVVKDEKKAFDWYQKAALAGSSAGQKNLGYCYLNGIGVNENGASALSWYRKSAAQGNEEGMAGVAWCYEKGEGVAKDEKEALRWYLQAVNQGDDWSMGQLARMYEDGRGTEKNPAEAFRWWNRKADAGDFWAPENVARCYANGIGTPKNQEEANKWYGKVRTKLEEKTASNEAWAWDNLGRFYFNGLGVEKNYAKALECYRKAADLKSGWAMEQIGWCNEKGFGVQVDEKEALRWYLQAGENGQAWSMGQCAIFYENGRGTEKNPAEAFRWYQKKADKGAGDLWADENVGRCHEKAIGTKKDDAEALRWYEKAARKGSLWAGEQAGRFYEEGLGTEKNREKAFGYYLPSVKAQRPWAQYRMVSLGSVSIYEGEYEFAERCFLAAWNSGYRPAADWLYQLHTHFTDGWEKSDPRTGIQIKRKSLRGQSDEGVESGNLAGQALELGYVAEAKEMVQELMKSGQIQADDQEKSRWHALAGYVSLIEIPIDPLVVRGKCFPESWLKKLENPPAVGMASFNMKIVHPQSRLDFRHSGDFLSPIAPRRWASYFIQHVKWGVQVWREHQLRGFGTLALTATGGPGKGGAFLWADFPLRKHEIAEEHFQIAESLAPNFAARLGRGILAWKDEDAPKARESLEPIQRELREEALAAAEKRKQKKLTLQDQTPKKQGWSLQVEHLAQNGTLPWGNAKGELSFGFGFSHGGLFHGQLVEAAWKLVVPFVLWLKPDWMLTAADIILQFGILSPMEMVDIYTSLAEKEETRGMACLRLAMMQAQLGEKEQAWIWAERAAQERPSDPEVLRMTVAVAHWAGKSKEAELWQRRFFEAKARRELLSQESPENEYLRIFEALHEAERLEALGKTSEADPKFQKVLQDLKSLSDHYPDWERAVVQYRIRSLEKKLSPKERKP